ncbi:MAG: hypothetical protein ACJAV7_001724 [Flavobacteriales bacterium]|jgi:hypothetical protein
MLITAHCNGMPVEKEEGTVESKSIRLAETLFFLFGIQWVQTIQ